VRPVLSTGAVSRYPQYPEHDRIVQHAPRVELELVIYPGWDERVVEDLQGLSFPTAHAEKSIGATLSGDEPNFDGFRLSCGIAAGVGAKLLVIHLWELPDGDRYLDRNLARLPALLDIADASGLVLAVETIPTSVGSPIDNVLRACEIDDRCRATADTEFLALHGELERAAELGDRLAHIHAKDFDREIAWDPRRWNRYLIPGEGSLDVDGFLAGLGWDGTVTLEMSAVREDGTVDAERLATGLAWLRRLRA
jgi:sugar phosphate isomerase/epimerase